MVKSSLVGHYPIMKSHVIMSYYPIIITYYNYIICLRHLSYRDMEEFHVIMG